HRDLNGKGPLERAQLAGISNFLNENIGRNINQPGKNGLNILHRQMMASPGHRPAIMDVEAHLVGIGSAMAGNRLFLVEVFGK
ncbi:CAP domain-containing protein, partial [Enterobacter kobei]